MINILYESNNFIILPKDDSGIHFLTKPLHKIYFRSNLNGSFNKSKSYWSIPTNISETDVLTDLLNYLKRYSIQYTLDTYCKKIIERIEKRKSHFKTIVTLASNVKRNQPSLSTKELHGICPEGFKRSLKDLQVQSLLHLIKVENGANFSVPGSGKTTIALSYFHYLHFNKIVKGLIVIGPTSCFEPWETEYAECFFHKPKSIRLAGLPYEKRKDVYLKTERYNLILITYHTAANDILNLIRLLSKRDYLLILDESHYVKRPKEGKLVDAVLAISTFAKRRIILSGTPMPNSLLDLWSQFTFLWPTQLPLGELSNYVQEINNRSNRLAVDFVKDRIFPFFFRITKSQLLLPRQIFKTITCNLSPLQNRIYRGIAARFLLQINEEPSDRESLRTWRRARMTRLLQTASNPTLLYKNCSEFQLPPLDFGHEPLRIGIEHYSEYEKPSKFYILENLLNELLGKYDKVIIWSYFVHNLIMLNNHFSKYNPVVLHGAIPVSSDSDDDITREQLIAKFKTDKSCKLFIANPAACAESISLHHVCHHAIYFDRTFNCAQYLQSLDRIHRLGLDDSQETFYYLITANNTIDEIITERLKYKMNNMYNVLEDDLPGLLPGYWSNDLGEEEDEDYRMFEEHLKSLKTSHER